MVEMEWYIRFLPCDEQSLVQISLTKSVGQNRMLHFVPAKCDEITCTSMHKSIGQNEKKN